MTINNFIINPKSSVYYMVTEKNGIIKLEEAAKNWFQIYTDIYPPNIYCAIIDEKNNIKP